ncbi:MAG: GGDEF domain-containing protein [Sulfurospirillum sp.]|nr:GGDEF domain-containing protein [Sulfurospirillum sp.]
MDKNKDFAKKIARIGEESFSKLQSLSVPPYPRYYHDTFIENLINSKDPSLTDLDTKHPNLFQSIFNTPPSPIPFDIAKTTLQEFETTNLNLKNISNENIIDIAGLKKEYDGIHFKQILDAFDTFQNKISNELLNADETITRLKLEVERLEREAHIDPLTKAYNRRILTKDLEEFITCDTQNLFVAMFDADDFKYINDTFGHVAGDKILIFIVKNLQNALKDTHRIYRYGGEEFVIILENTTQAEAQTLINVILKEIDQSKLLYKGDALHVTLSAGLTQLQKGDSADMLIERADKALYEAKQSGKNCLKVGF